MSKKLVAILIPLTFQKKLTPAEEVSLRHLEYYLSKYDRFFIAPRGVHISYSDIKTVTFKDKYFGSFAAHTRLSLSKELYRTFREYEFVLMYHLDCLVFDDTLSEWCELGYDFIGPPWIEGPDLPWLKKNGVGNAGFSLRRVESFLKLLNSKVYWRDAGKIPDSPNRSRTYNIIKANFRKIAYRIRPYNNMQRHIEYHISRNWHDDGFISSYARKYYPEFKIAPIEVALQFGFEAHPRKCYEMNNRQIPFGCHAWERFDKEFWEPYLIQ